MKTNYLLTPVALLVVLCGSVAAGAEFYVSPGGADTNPGSQEKPFATLERARDAVRAVKQQDGILKDGCTVWLMEGDYFLEHSLELSAEDSGTADAPVVWKALSGTKVRILGGRIITGFQPVTDEAVLARLQEAARAQVVSVDLRALGIEDYGTFKSRGFARNASYSHGELFFDGRPMTLARWPNEGEWQTITGFPEDAETKDEHGGHLGALTDGFFYESDEPKRWQQPDNLWVHGYWAYDWANSYEQVAELDAEKQFIRTAEPYGHYGFRKGQRFYCLNVLEELDTPGEWFIDRETGILYFWPPDAVDSGEALYSLLEQPFIKCTGASHILFQGLAFEAGRGNAIEITDGENVRVSGCLIRNMGTGAVAISNGKNHGVSGCDIFDTGDGGVALSGGDRQTLTPGGHFAENCHFGRLGRWSKCYVPAVLLAGVGQRASHNLIHDHPHCAILFWGNDHLMEYNDIHHIALETGDVGAIYTGRDYTFRGNRIVHNYIHETGGVGMGSMGVYMDDCVSGTEVFGNVFYKAHWAMFIGGGRDHKVINNLFVDCDPAVRADGRGLDTSPVWHNMVDKTMRDRLADVPLALYRERYPEMKTLDAHYGPPDGEAITGESFKGVPPEGNLITKNVCFGKWTDITWHAKEEWFDIRDNYVTDDMSGIGSPETGFQIPEDSPARETDFETIPFDKIGMQTDGDREYIPKD